MAILGTVKLVAYDFVPRGFAECNGQQIKTSEHTALFSLLGTTYGGDGRIYFNLPDLSGRAPVHVGPKNKNGAHGGSAVVSLNVSTMPQHNHSLYATQEFADQPDPTGNMLAAGPPRGLAHYVDPGSSAKTNMAEHALQTTGGGQPHNNMQPYLTVKYVMATEGVFPSRSANFLSDDEGDFLGDIRPMSFGFAPRRWEQCNGQLLEINGHQSLYSLLGTRFGGDGRRNFALPDLRGRVPIGDGDRDKNTYTMGDLGGTETVTLTEQETPPHFHQVQLADADPTTTFPGDMMLASKAPIFTDGAPNAAMAALQVSEPSGSGAAHNNMMAFETVNFCICTDGLFPSRN